MKRIILFFPVLFSIFLACNTDTSTNQPQEGDTTTVEFPDTNFDFGTIEQGEQIMHTFKFKNTGDKPLLISEVHTSCGCTVADYTDKPVNPQSEGYIKVTFNSAGKHGEQYKTITIVSNTKPEKTQLVITGTVNVPEN